MNGYLKAGFLMMALGLGGCGSAPADVPPLASETGLESPDAGDSEPSGNWMIGHSLSTGAVTTGSVEIELTPSEVARACALILIQNDVNVGFLLHRATVVPTMVSVFTTTIPQDAVAYAPKGFDCAIFPNTSIVDNVFESTEASSSTVFEEPLSLQEGEVLLLEYDVENTAEADAAARLDVALISSL